MISHCLTPPAVVIGSGNKHSSAAVVQNAVRPILGSPSITLVRWPCTVGLLGGDKLNMLLRLIFRPLCLARTMHNRAQDR